MVKLVDTNLNYENIAPYYDAIIGDRTHEILFLKNLIIKYKPDAKTVLDIGCGTGEVMSLLGGNMSVTGLDQSPTMLQLAATKVPSAQLLQGDMCNFKLDKQFDVVLCTRDSISQFIELSQWKQVFARAVQHLANGGVFIFDYSSIKRLTELSNSPSSVVQFSNGYIETKVAKAPSMLFDWEVEINLKRSEDDYRQIRELIMQTSFPMVDVIAAAENYFMETVEALDSSGNPASDESDRIYIACC